MRAQTKNGNIITIQPNLVMHDYIGSSAIPSVTTQDFIKFWGKIFVFILLMLIGISQGFKTF
jgi:hypothetical protein